MFRTLKSADWFHADGFPIAVERREPQNPFPAHRHEFSEIVVVTGGKGRHVVGNQSWSLSAGDVFVIGGPRVHEFGERDKLSLINLLFQPEKLKLETADLAQLPGYHALFGLEPTWRRRHEFKNRLRLSPRALGRLLALVDQLDEELRLRNPGFGFVATAIFSQIVASLSRSYDHSPGADSRNRPRIAEAISHLETNADQPTSLTQLAQVARMSRRSLIRAFHEATGATPIAYWNQLRINRAAALLRSCPDPITEIAFRVGFSDSNYFTRQFRKRLGLSPRRYRQQHSTR
jgi:AraC-like DNA-binding protein